MRCKKTVDDVVAQLVEAIAPLAASLTDQECLELAACIDRSIKHQRQPRWYVDISVLVCTDAKTGIQRVVRSILTSWLNSSPVGVEIVPVYASNAGAGHRRAARFIAGFIGRVQNTEDVDEWVEFQAGDVFLGLDLNPSLPEQRDFLQSIRNHGVSTYVVVYDMLPVKMPDNFPKDWETIFNRWLDVVAECNGAICISHAVADELALWLGSHAKSQTPGHRPFHIDWFHLGADFDNSQPSDGLPENWQAIETLIQRTPTFLMVGTLEPRKGHAEVLDAFESLWANGVDLNLIILGKEGWHAETLVERLRKHPENMRRLVWLDGVSDECLQHVYAEADCLIAASLGEGFGLPLIEAAQHGLPILARDIPVFKEVAGRYASYFGTDSGQDLTGAVRAWLKLHAAGDVPESVGMSFQSWRESADQLANLILYRSRP